MPIYCLIETEDGATIAEQRAGMSAEETADHQGGTLLDPGPYQSFEEAQEALLALQEELGDDSGDVAGDRSLEPRPERPT
jgi:hypothetical protein